MDENTQPHGPPCPRPEFFVEAVKKLGAVLAGGWGAGVTIYVSIDAIRDFDPLFFSCISVGVLGCIILLIWQIHEYYGSGSETPLQCTRRILYEVWQQIPFMTKRVVVITRQAIRVMCRRAPKKKQGSD